MNPRTNFFAALALAVGLALLTPGSAISQTNTEAAAKDENTFTFPGGKPRAFLAAVEKFYKVNWSSVATIPDEMQDVHIPALRIYPESARAMFRNGLGGRRGGGGGGGGGGGFFGGGMDSGNETPLDALIALYNHLGNLKPELGQLVVEGDTAKPSVVMFHTTRSRGPLPEIKVKAFPLRGIPESEWGDVEDLINTELLMMRMEADKRGAKGQPQTDARVNLHKETGLLIVGGSDSFLETAESIVNAWHANHDLKVPGK